MKTSNATWTSWLNDHASYATYNAHPTMVKDICSSPESITNFEKLTSSKNIILLTKAPMGGKCQATFWHSTIGIPIIPDDLHYVARVGMKTGTGVEIDAESLFHSTALKTKPDLLDLMKVASPAEFTALKANKHAAKKTFQCFAVLTPSLAQAIQHTDMTYAAIFMAIVKQIKIDANPAPPPPDEETKEDEAAPEPETEDDLLLAMAAPYDSLLYFLWACLNLKKETKAPNMVTLQDDVTIAWEETTRLQCLGNPKPPKEIDLTNTDRSDISAGAISAMTKLSASMIKHQEFALKSQEDKSDSRMKAWRRLPKIQQNVIVLAGVEEDGTVPKEPTEEMLSILGCQNGAQVDQYLRACMPGFNMSLEPGFCTALNKGMLVCPDDVSIPKNFTPFLTPPVNDDDDAEDNANLLKLAVQEKYDTADLILLTKMDIAIPMEPQELKHHMKNFTGMAGRLLGEDSMAHSSLTAITAHIEANETSYNYEFRQEKLFGGNFLDRVNWRFHRFLGSCTNGDAKNIDTAKLDFTDMLEQIERREYHTKVPSWIRKIMKKKEKKSSDRDTKRHGGGGGGGGEEKTRRQFGTDSDRSKKIANAHPQEDCTLKITEQFRDLFHPGNIRNMDKPNRNDGGQMCLRFHCLGFCFTNCKFKDGHSRLDAPEIQRLKTFVDGARSNRASYNQNRNGNGTNPLDRNRNRNGNQNQQQPGRPANGVTPAAGES